MKKGDTLRTRTYAWRGPGERERAREGGSDGRREAGAGGTEKERKKGQTRFRFRR